MRQTPVRRRTLSLCLKGAMMIERFSLWVGATPLSEALKEVSWMVPLSQTIHILAVAAILSAYLLMTARAVGVTARTDSLVMLERRFMPWVWGALLALTFTGILQLTAEPERSFVNPFFQAKVVMLAVTVALTLWFQRTLRRDPRWGALPVMPIAIRAVLVTVIALLLAIIFCGRWIAYSSV